MKTIRAEELRPVFAALEETFAMLGIDYYVIGAKARDAWFEKAKVRVTGTKDIDFAVMVGSEEAYQQIFDHLTAHKGYTSSANNAHAIISPEGHVVDLLPFGAVEIDGAVTFAAQGSNDVKVNGFMEVYLEGTEEVEIIDGHTFQVAAIVVGREIGAILNNNPTLLKRIDTFLATEISKVSKSKFVIEMTQETGKNVEEIINLLLFIRTGLQGRSDSNA